MTSADASTLQEVVVTARRRSEICRTCRSRVTALNAEQLQTQNVQSLTDVTAVAPNIEVNAGARPAAPLTLYIRGVARAIRCGF